MSQGKEIKYEEKIPHDAKSTEVDVIDRMKAGPFLWGAVRHLIKSKVELQITIGTFLQGLRRLEIG